MESVSQEFNVIFLLLSAKMWKEDALRIVHEVKELLASESLLANLVRVEDVTDLKDLVLQQV